MARQTLLITPQVLREAIDKAATGGADEEIGDTAVRGLCLRLRGKSAVWAVRGRLGGEGSPKPFRLCDARPDGLNNKALERELERARALATETKNRLKRGIDPREWLREQELGGAVVKPEAEPVADKGQPWREALDAWLEHLIERGLRVDSVKSYRSCLIAPGTAAAFADKGIREITKADVETARDRLLAEGKRRQSNAVVQAAKLFLEWALGEDNNPAVGVKKKGSSGSGDRCRDEGEGTYTPRPEELADLFDKLAKPDISPIGRLACTLLLCTGQRRRTVTHARIEDFEPWDLADGWGLWRIPGKFMKSRRNHALPIPPRAWQVVQVAKAMAGASPWLFPQTKRRYATDEREKPISETLLNNTFKKAEIGWGPHDTRRALVALGERRGVPVPFISVVLDHKRGDVPQVTIDNYGRILEFKSDKHYVLTEWMDYLDHCDRTYGESAKRKNAAA